MKFHWESRDAKQRRKREWHMFFALWPRRITDEHVAVGRIMRRRNDSRWQYRSIEEHARIALLDKHNPKKHWMLRRHAELQKEADNYMRDYLDSSKED